MARKDDRILCRFSESHYLNSLEHVTVNVILIIRTRCSDCSPGKGFCTSGDDTLTFPTG